MVNALDNSKVHIEIDGIVKDICLVLVSTSKSLEVHYLENGLCHFLVLLRGFCLGY